jgi:hypothetical protein
MMDDLFSTARLYFRQFSVGDEQKLFDLNSDEEVVKFTGNASMKDLAEAHDVLVNIILPQYNIGFGRWAVYRKEDDAFLGWCGLKKLEDHTIDLGYRFFRNIGEKVTQRRPQLLHWNMVSTNSTLTKSLHMQW